MSTSRLMVLFLAASLCGCSSHRHPPLLPPATAYTAEWLQAEYRKIDPSAHVGLVAAVTPADKLVAVSHMDVAAFHPGVPITFMDTNKDIIGSGSVVRSVNHLLIVLPAYRHACFARAIWLCRC